MKTKLTVVSLCLLLVACMSTDPYTGAGKTSNTTKGAGVGAVTGALIGIATSSKKDRNKGALIGALGGAAIGGGVGFRMDKQEAELRAKLEGSGIRVVRQGDEVQLIMPGHLTFQTGSYQVRSDFYTTLESIVIVLKKYTKTEIRIAGHTDSVGDDSYNQTLSERRADSVGKFLISQGVLSGRVNSTGYGERRPIADNNSDSGRQSNRRVELTLHAKG